MALSACGFGGPPVVTAVSGAAGLASLGAVAGGAGGIAGVSLAAGFSIAAGGATVFAVMSGAPLCDAEATASSGAFFAPSRSQPPA